MWKINIEDDQSNVTGVNLVRDEYSIGRDVDNSVRLTERNISRRHAMLKRNGVGWVIKDLSSYNGCYVNGKRISEEQPLKHGDLMQLGDYRLELMDESLAAQGDPLSKTSTAPGRFSQTLRELPNRLVMVAGPAIGVPFSLNQKRMVVGRGEECDLPINDTSVSRVHAEIRAVDDGRYEIMDLGSSNGVRVNGAELKRALLDAGDIIELGDVQLKYVPAGQIWNPQDPVAPAARRNSLEPGVGDHLGTTRGGTGRIVAGVALVATIAAVFIVVTRSGGSDGSSALATEEPPVNPAAQALEDARQLLAQGDLEGAMKKTQTVPQDSNLRESTVFKEIQAKWADALFEQASAEADSTRRRALLDQIAKSPDVGSTQRKRAVTEIAALDQDSVDIDDLPSVSRGEPEDEAKTASKAPAGATASKTSAATPKVSAPKPTRTAAPPQTTPVREQRTAEEPKGGLIRDTPF